MEARLLPLSRPKRNLDSRSAAKLHVHEPVFFIAFDVAFLLLNSMSKRLLNAWKPQTSSAYICRSCRSKLFPAEANRQPLQKRWITRNHIRRIKTAEEEWAERADMINAGRKQSILSLLEERGYVNQIVGCAWL